MSHCGNHRKLTVGNGPGHGFLIESPEVLETAATPGHEDGIQLTTRLMEFIQLADGGSDFAPGTASLDAARDEEQLQPGESSADHMEHIPNGGTGG
jgi:hypothetical protein